VAGTCRALGPGFVSGASDNDPTTVGTVAVVGSTTVYALGWVALLIFPMLAVVQAIASAFLAMPVLIATAAHFVCVKRHWCRGLSRSPRGAPQFYAAMTVTLAIAVVVSFLNISPIDLLFAASIAGGIGTPLGLVYLLKVARDHETMGPQRISRRLTAAGYTVTAVVSVFGIAGIVTG
jgi:Mn2+/Fe2+ NRAMP family transporter